MNISGIGSYARYMSASPNSGAGKAASSTSAQALTSAEAVTGQKGATSAQAADFSSMTKKDFVAWGKDQFAKGNITLDDLFQVQQAGGDLDGSVKTDSSSQNFTKVFQDRIAFERSTGRANDPKSMIGVYSHLLSVMNGPISIAA